MNVLAIIGGGALILIGVLWIAGDMILGAVENFLRRVFRQR